MATAPNRCRPVSSRVECPAPRRLRCTREGGWCRRQSSQWSVDPGVNGSLTHVVQYHLAVAPRAPLKRALAALADLEASRDALDRLDLARMAREASEELERDLVRSARRSGATWTAIGALYGLTKQGAQQRFRDLDDPTR